MKKIIINILFVILLFNSLDIDELSAYECLVEGDITGDDRLDARDFLVLKDWLLTGDNNAGCCLIGAFEVNDKTYISIVVGCNSNNDRYSIVSELISKVNFDR